MRKNRVALAVSAAVLAICPALVAARMLPAAASPETYSKITCTTNKNLKKAGYAFAYAAHGNDYPAKVRIKIFFYRSSTSLGASVKDDDVAETTTSRYGIWSSDAFYDKGMGSAGGHEQVRVAVERASNGAVLGQDALDEIPYSECK